MYRGQGCLSVLICLFTAVFKQLIYISINNLMYRQRWPLRSKVFLKRTRHVILLWISGEIANFRLLPRFSRNTCQLSNQLAIEKPFSVYIFSSNNYFIFMKQGSAFSAFILLTVINSLQTSSFSILESLANKNFMGLAKSDFSTLCKKKTENFLPDMTPSAAL